MEERTAAEPASVHARCGHVDRSSSGSARDGGADMAGVVGVAAWHGGGARRSGGRLQRGVIAYMVQQWDKANSL
jgi:hypothetical protein